MKPKDLLVHLEKGDRTMELLAPEPGTQVFINSNPFTGSINVGFLGNQLGMMQDASLETLYRQAIAFGNGSAQYAASSIGAFSDTRRIR